MVVVVENMTDWVVVGKAVVLVEGEVQKVECSNLMEGQQREGEVAVEWVGRCSNLMDLEVGKDIETDGEAEID